MTVLTNNKRTAVVNGAAQNTWINTATLKLNMIMLKKQIVLTPCYLASQEKGCISNISYNIAITGVMTSDTKHITVYFYK